MSLLPVEMQTFEYYKALTPMYLQETVGFMEHLKILFDVGFADTIFTIGNDVICSNSTIVGYQETSIFSFGKELFKRLDLFDIIYSNFSSLQNDDILDKLAALFGVSRNFTVTNSGVDYELTLSNSDLILLIKCQVIKNFFDGSSLQLTDYYKLVNLPVIALTSSTAAANCNMYMLLMNANEVSENVKKMFLAGLLSIESLGIRYTYAIQIAPNIAFFDSFVVTSVFDAGQFVL